MLTRQVHHSIMSICFVDRRSREICHERLKCILPATPLVSQRPSALAMSSFADIHVCR